MILKNKVFTFDLLRSELLRNASVLISGAIIAQLISILLQPLLRRLYTPASFGMFSVYMSLVGIIVIVSSLRYDDTIVLPESDKESINLLGLSLIFNLLINFIIFLIVLVLGKRLISFLNLPSSFPVFILYIIPLSTLLLGTYQSLNAWLIRKKKYYAVSVNKLVRRSSEGAAQVSFAFLKIFNGLIYSDIIGQTANLTITAIQSKRSGLTLKLVSLPKLKYVLHKFSEFPKFNLLPAMMSTCSYLLPPIFINKYFSPELAGFFDLSKLVLSIPLAFIASSLTSVLLQRISEKYNRNESILNDIKPVFLTVCSISVLEIIVILIFGEGLFKIVFGKQWLISGSISKIMVWSFALNFMVSSFTSIFVSMRRIKTYSIWQSIYFVAIISLLFFKNLPFNDFIKVYVLIEVLCYITVAAILFFIIYRYESSVRVEKLF
jgi:O-antigen/teichoic acid export membrane protein